MVERKWRAGVYMRLSRDDEGGKESASITNQRKLLLAYAQEQGFAIVEEYVDDGYSGTSFDRPGFQRLLGDIETGLINLVLTKDLSRLGRDYIAAGQYTELYFPSKGVRYIAVNDGYDSASPYTDIAPFKNVMNEMYARDTSRKIRSSLETKMREGSYIGAFAPYGYEKDPVDKNRLIPDKEAAAVVRRIFRLAAEGVGLSQIAEELNAGGIPTPLTYRRMKNPHLTGERGGRWTRGSVAKILRNETYLGNTVQGKTAKISFKSKMTVQKGREDWIVVEGTHPPLVDRATFELVQRAMSRRVCRKQGRFHNLFSGLAKCADCGKNMSATGTRKKGAAASLVCGGYKLGGKAVCSNHAIDYDTLYAIVRDALAGELDMEKREPTPALLLQLIEKIEIGQGHYEKVDGKRIKRQEITIHFRFQTDAREYQYTV